ncbi:MAG: glycosyltransferase [Planctomycetes bacterium]|nr:glycosyltransferase [Planctomycetota bacterium]
MDKFSTINNGIDHDLLEREPAPRADNGRLRLLHIGAIYGRRYPGGLVRALARLRASDAALFARILVEQVGRVDEQQRLVEEASRLGLSEHFVVSGPVAHAEAFRRCQAADGLLLLGPSGREPEVQVPSKLFEYLAAGRPILALARSGGAIATVLEQARAPCLLADPDDPEAILAGLRRFAAGTLPAAGGRAAAVARFGYEHLASLLERELEQASCPTPRWAAAPAQEA